MSCLLPFLLQTGGWGGLEYGTVGFTRGQVLGGRWKPLHYFLAQFLFTDAFATCGVDGRCLFKNDNPLQSLHGNGTLTLLHVPSGNRTELSTVPLALPRGAGSSIWRCSDGSQLAEQTPYCQTWTNLLPQYGCNSSGSDCLLLVGITSDSVSSGGALVQRQLSYSNPVLLATPSQMLAHLPAAIVQARVGTTLGPDGSRCAIELSTDHTALFVVLTTLAQGRFSSNVLVLTPQLSPLTVEFIGFGGSPVDRDLLQSSLRVEHVAMYARRDDGPLN
jgi:hypothetical protein